MIAGFALGALSSPAGCAAGQKLARGSLRSPGFFRSWCLTAATWGAVDLCGENWAWAAGEGLSSAVALALWWWSRRKGRKRAAKPLGARAFALRERLVKSMPRWTPRLQPEGSPA